MGPLDQWTPDGSLAKLLQWRVEEAPEHEFLYVEDDGPWSFGQIADEAVRLRDQLHVHGVSRGDLVVVRVGNDERFIAAAFGVWLLGGGVIAVHPSAPASDIVSVADSMRAEAVIADPQDGAARAAGLPVVASARFPTRRRRGSDQSGSFTAPSDIAGTSIALVLLTSGSTGKPKGVALSHDGAWANLRSTVSAFRTDTHPTALPESPKPPNLIANPLSHTAGVVRLLFALYVGRSVALLRKFDGVTAKRLIERHHIDNLTINPAMMRILLDTLPPGERLGAVRYASSGTAPLPAALREEFESRFDVPVLQAYGQTEAFGGIAIESVKDVLSGRRRPGSVGKPLPGVELRIVDPSGVDVAGGSVGELWVRTKSTTSGYLGSSDNSPVDSNGWLRTGDQGRLDSDGYLYITGRLKNIIICGGFNIVPEEIEAALIEDESVREAVVLGIADTRLGEVPVAVVESHADSAALLARIADRLAPYKRPRQLFCVERLPRVPNGKVDRPAVAAIARELATAAAGQHISASDGVRLRCTISTDERDELRNTARRFFEKNSPEEVVRATMESTPAFDRALWQAMSEQLGLPAVLVPEEFGGAGFGFGFAALVLEELGRALVCVPFLSTAVIAVEALVASEDTAGGGELLSAIADGSLLVAVAFTDKHGHLATTQDGDDGVRARCLGDAWALTGVRQFVVDAPVADVLLVLAESDDDWSLFRVPASGTGVTVETLETLDLTRGQAHLHFDSAPAQLIGEAGRGHEYVQRALNAGLVGVAAEQVGGARRAMEMSVEYAKVREQFGRPIGSFQAIKHKCADMLMGVESATSAVYAAALAIEEGSAESALLASLAKAYCSDAYCHVAAENIQVHGGIGFTWEHPAHLYFRRAKSTRVLFGDPVYHRERILQELGL